MKGLIRVGEDPPSRDLVKKRAILKRLPPTGEILRYGVPAAMRYPPLSVRRLAVYITIPDAVTAIVSGAKIDRPDRDTVIIGRQTHRGYSV